MFHSRPARTLLAALLVLVGCAATPASTPAAVPETMSYQGLLSDDLGAPLADGAHELVLRAVCSRKPTFPTLREVTAAIS